MLSLLYEELRKEEVSVGVGLFASSDLDSARTFLESQKGGAILLIDDIDRLDDAVIKMLRKTHWLADGMKATDSECDDRMLAINP